LHIDLSNTGLTEYHLVGFGKTLRRSKSLRCIHFSGNYITFKAIHKLVNEAHGVISPKIENIQHNDIPSF
jgi:hypothetical protein